MKQSTRGIGEIYGILPFRFGMYLLHPIDKKWILELFIFQIHFI